LDPTRQVLAAKISTVLGFDDKAQMYHAAAHKRAVAVTSKFANSDGVYDMQNDSTMAPLTPSACGVTSGVYLDMLQTHSVMPLAAGLVPAGLASKTMANLAHAITVIDKVSRLPVQ
jgi:hypothetical protein